MMLSISTTKFLIAELAVADGIKAHYKDADIEIYPAGGLCSYYVERDGILVGCETE